MKKIFNIIVSLLLGIAFCLLLFWLGYTFWQTYQPQALRLQGQIEAQQYSVSSKVAGRIAEVYVRKGDPVRRGQAVFLLQSPELEAKIKQAEAGQMAAEALAEEAEIGARKQEVAAAKNKWQTARAAAVLAEKTYQRVENLYRDGVVPAQKRDEAQANLEAAENTEQAAYQIYQMTKEGTRSQKKRAARGKEQMAAEAVAEVKAYAEDLEVTSWYDGEVSQVLLHPGELAPQGFPVVSIVDMKDCWLTLHIREDLLENWKIGTEFHGIIPALGEKKVGFKVTHIAVMGDYATWRATNLEKDFDMRTFEVEARPLEQIEDLRAGMSVLVTQ
ncbi:MAG: hypothetical protein CSB23_04985 [Deltaproteobacteria bacterium]|nr:MAG: hypothetical protein CSB23_04985 [Deltaproteobacteria bacterium]